MSNPPCDMCGAPSTTADGIVGAYLCDETPCFHRAWDIAFGVGDTRDA